MFSWQMEGKENKNVLNQYHCDHCDIYLRGYMQLSLSLLFIHDYNFWPPKQEEFHLSARIIEIVSATFTNSLVKRTRKTIVNLIVRLRFSIRKWNGRQVLFGHPSHSDDLFTSLCDVL